MGINQFLLRAEMYERVQGLEERRRGRRAVIRAVILLMQQDGLDEEGAYSQLRRDSMRARQNMELYCEEFMSKRAKPPDTSGRTTGITLQGGNKQAI
jgi:AmiR/NasT family two-component response regulator